MATDGKGEARAATASLGSPALQKLAAALRGELIVPADAGYEEARRVWNGMIDRRPAAVARCRGAADVMACIDLAREEGVPLAVRGGGHNVAGGGVCDGGLVIDLSPMRSVLVDPRKQIAVVEGGATLGDVDRETYAHGLATPTGVVSETGYAGLTLHGGLGWQTRKRGLALDNVLGVDVVTADGRLLRADAEHNTDLFWAVRGGGGNFGVVTSFTVRLFPMPAELTFAIPIFALDDAAEVLRFLRDFMPTAPEELMVVGALWSVPDEPELPAEHRGEPALFLLCCHLGPAAEGEAAVAPLRECRPRIADLTGRLPWTDVQRFLDRDYPDGDRYYWKSTFVKELTDPMIEAMVAHGRARPSPRSTVDLWTLGGAFARVGAADTAFGDRGVPYLVNYEATWSEPAQDEANVTWTRESLQEIEVLSQSRTYLNFPGQAEEGETMIATSYGQNYARLRQIKAKYDPQDLFGGRLGIRPASAPGRQRREPA